MQDELLIHPPLFLLTTEAQCWKCKIAQPICALACHNLNDGDHDLALLGDASEFLLLYYVTRLPSAVWEQVKRRSFGYQLGRLTAFEEEYFANHCLCSSLFGDHHLHTVPGGQFFPEDAEAARTITIERLVFDVPQLFECSYSIGDTGGDVSLSMPNGLGLKHEIQRA